MQFDDLENNWVTVYKLNERGDEITHYDAEVVAKGANFVCVRAAFIGRRAEVRSGFLLFRTGDAMTEWFYNDRWYNIFRLQEGSRGPLKGFYCNITRPAKISEEVVTAEDLALDVLVSPQGEIMVMDEDEFEIMSLPADDRTQALKAVEQLKALVARREPPFDEIKP
ncbi:MAG: DUF402 domain-containing protein [Anaerolineae bacterium]